MHCVVRGVTFVLMKITKLNNIFILDKIAFVELEDVIVGILMLLKISK